MRRPNVLSLLGGLVAIKTLIITTIGPRVGLTLQESIRIGLLLSQGGEFGFVVFSLANRLGVLPLELHKLLIIVVVLSMALTLLLNEIGRRAAGIVDEKSETKEKPAEMMNYDATEPIVILGFGEMGKVLAKFLSAPLSFGLDQDAEGWPYVAFDLNPAVVKSARKSGFPALYGDGSRPAVLQSAGISSPKAVMVMYTGKEKTIEAVNRLRQTFPGVPMYARAQDMSHLLDLKKAGATEVVLENAETSLQLGSILLKGLGVMSDDVSFLSKLVRDSMELQAQEALNNIEDREIDIMKPLQIYDYQHNLGLILLERKELTSKYEQLRASSESAEIMHKRERASQQSALAEARKREENLKKNLGIQKECVANLEKALHDMRGETAELKVSYETKLAEAFQMMEAAQKKFDEAEEKLLSAKSLEAESTRTRNAALRSLQDMEDREDQLRRYRISCEFEYETKENGINLQRKSLNDTKKILHEKEQVLLKEQALLNQRDENILERLAYITHSEKRLEEEKLILEAEQKVLLEEKNKLDLKMEAIVSREEAVIQKESILDKRESELLIFQETIASKERAEIERLSQEQEIALERRKHEFETEIENKRMSFEAEMKAKRTLLDQRESALNEQESAVAQRDQNVDLQLAELANKEVTIAGRSDELKEEEGKLFSHREALQIELQKEREEIQKMKLDLEKEKAFFEEEKRDAIQAQQNLAITQADRDDLLTLQMKLKEEIDSLRAQKKELMADADRLQAEKERFEIEWELIDEKKEELQKEAVRIAEERRVITEHLKNESDIIKQEKDNLRVQFKNNSETLSHEHEEFMSKMQQEHASWLSNIQQEREDLKRDINIQRMELLNSAKARHMEIDSYLRQREEEFEQKKSKELEYITSQKEMINSKLEHVAQELQKLEDERKEATLERERREQELSEIKSTIEALNNQREKLQEQRKLLHSDREAITEQIQQLNLLEELKIDSENNQLSLRETRKSKLGSMTKVKDNGLLPAPGEDHNASPKNCSSPKLLLGRKLEVSPSVSTPISWVRKCAQVIFKRSPEKSAEHDEDSLVQNGVPTKLGKAADINNSLLADQLENGAGEVPRAVDGAKVGKKRLNYLVSCDQSEVLEPRRKQRRSTIQKANGGEITSNSPYVLEECSKNEHDAAPLGLSGACKDCELDNKGPENLRTPVDPASSDDVPYENGKADNSDFVDDDEPSEEIAVSATEPSNGDGLEDKDEHNEESDDEDEEEEKTSSAKKLWRFLIT